MAVIVSDGRTIWSQCDAADWDGSETDSLYTTEPSPIEDTGCLGFVVSTQTSYSYYTGAAVNLSGGVQVFVWSWNRAALDTLQNGGIGIVLGDGNNTIGFHLAGSNVAAFRYNEAVDAQWQCLMFDTARIADFDNVNYFYTEHVGTLANLDLTQITQIGIQYKTLSKAIGNIDNCFVDIVRHGNEGLIVQGGSSGDPGTLDEIYQEDRSNSNEHAYGIIREFSSGVYGLQGSLTFSGTDSTSSFFSEIGSTIIFEDRLIANNVYELKVLGDPIAYTSFKLDSCTIQSAGPGLLFDANSGGIDILDIQNCLFSNITQGVLLGTDSTDAASHVFSNNTIQGSGVFEPGIVPIRDVTVTTAVLDSTAQEAAMLWSDLTDAEDMIFSDNEFAIRHDSNGTVTYTNFFFNNNTYDVLFLGTGTLTINVVGGDAPTYLAPNGGTVTIVAAVDWYFEIQDQQGSIVNTAEFRIYDDNDVELYGVETSDGTEKYTFNGTISGTNARIVVHDLNYLHFTQTLVHPSSSNSAAAPIVFTLVTDRVYENP